MTQRQMALIDEWCAKLNEINEWWEVDPDRTNEIMKKYRIEDLHKTLPEIYQYMPNPILDAIIAELNEQEPEK